MSKILGIIPQAYHTVHTTLCSLSLHVHYNIKNLGVAWGRG